MNVAVIQFPGSNCDQDALWAVRDGLNGNAEYVWHQSTSLAGFDAVFVPGGFTYGDYLRCGAMAARSPVMEEVRRFANEGRPVIGACNGFQILCEAGILPGALMNNGAQKFLCQDVHISPVNKTSRWTVGVPGAVRIPIAHNEGRFVCDDDTLSRLQDDGLIAFRYTDAKGQVTEKDNPNGATDAIAGIVNPAGNVLGLMPHPERATTDLLGGADGLYILAGLKT